MGTTSPGSAGHRRLTIFAGGVPLLLQSRENCNIRWNIAGPLLTINSQKRMESVFWYDASFSRTAWHPPDRLVLTKNDLQRPRKSQQATLTPRVASLRLISTHSMSVSLFGDRRCQTQLFHAGRCLTWPESQMSGKILDFFSEKSNLKIEPDCNFLRFSQNLKPRYVSLWQKKTRYLTTSYFRDPYA